MSGNTLDPSHRGFFVENLFHLSGVQLPKEQDLPRRCQRPTTGNPRCVFHLYRDADPLDERVGHQWATFWSSVLFRGKQLGLIVISLS